MPYINDVFISYKRSKINEQWLDEIFLPYFKEYLDNALPYSPRIFVDRSGLTPGVDFSNELFRNLVFSRCMVSIWSPPYFKRSEWCIKEFLTMKYREETFKLNANTLPKSLIWPVLYREIDPMPPIIKNISYLNYTDYNVIGEAFFKTEKFLNFQKDLQKDIKIIANIILNVPPFNQQWDTEEGRTQIVQELNTYLENQNFIDENIKQSPISW